MKQQKADIIKSSGVHPDSPIGKELSSDVDRAEKALAETNCEELFTLWQKAVKAGGESLKTMSDVASHFMGTKNTPMYSPSSSDSIASMERVALAAIQLARDVAIKDKQAQI